MQSNVPKATINIYDQSINFNGHFIAVVNLEGFEYSE